MRTFVAFLLVSVGVLGGCITPDYEAPVDPWEVFRDCSLQRVGIEGLCQEPVPWTPAVALPMDATCVHEETPYPMGFGIDRLHRAGDKLFLELGSTNTPQTQMGLIHIKGGPGIPIVFNHTAIYELPEPLDPHTSITIYSRNVSLDPPERGAPWDITWQVRPAEDTLIFTARLNSATEGELIIPMVSRSSMGNLYPGPGEYIYSEDDIRLAYSMRLTRAYTATWTTTEPNPVDALLDPPCELENSEPSTNP